MVLAVVAAVAAVAVVLVLVTSGGDDDTAADQSAGGSSRLTSGGGAPRGRTVSGVPSAGTAERKVLDTVARFYDDSSAGDYGPALEHATGAARTAVLDAQARHQFLNGPKGHEIIDFRPRTVEISADGGFSTVTLTLILADDSEPDGRFKVQYERGVWKVSELPAQMLPR
jgi:hypothetical protein